MPFQLNGELSVEPQSATNALIAGDPRAVLREFPSKYDGKIDLLYSEPPYENGYHWNDPECVAQVRAYEQYLSDLFKASRRLLAPGASVWVLSTMRLLPHIRIAVEHGLELEYYLKTCTWQHHDPEKVEKGGWRTDTSAILVFTPDAEAFEAKRALRSKALRTTHISAAEGGTYDLGTQEMAPYQVPGKWRSSTPERLLERVIETATDPGGLVLGAFAGGGAVGAVAHRLGRRWLVVDSRAELLCARMTVAYQEAARVSTPGQAPRVDGFRFLRHADP